MERGIAPTLAVATLTLVAVIYSYFALSGQLGAIEEGQSDLQSGGFSITVHGVDSTETWRSSGAGNCSPNNQTQAEVAVSNGAAGNQVRVDAVCTLGNGPFATATATDPGTGQAQYQSGLGNPGQGAAQCNVSFPTMTAPGSTWVAVCTF